MEERTSTFRCAKCRRKLPEKEIYRKRIQRSLCLDCAAKGYQIEVVYDGVVNPRKHWVAVTWGGKTGPGGRDHE